MNEELRNKLIDAILRVQLDSIYSRDVIIELILEGWQSKGLNHMSDDELVETYKNDVAWNLFDEDDELLNEAEASLAIEKMLTTQG